MADFLEEIFQAVQEDPNSWQVSMRTPRGAYLEAACQLTERDGDFDKYSLAQEVEKIGGCAARPVKAAQTWIGRQGRRTGVTKRTALAQNGAMKHGGEPSRHKVTEYFMNQWRSAQKREQDG